MLFLSSSQDIAKFGHCSVFFIFFFANLLFTSSFMLLCVCRWRDLNLVPLLLEVTTAPLFRWIYFAWK